MTDTIAQKERDMLILEARDACARRISSSTSIGAADSAQLDLKFRLKKINAMGDDKLLESAAKREQAKANDGKFRLDEWTCIAPAPTEVPFELKPNGSTFRGMRDLEQAKAYAEAAADFFHEHGVDKKVFVVGGPTSTTKLPFEVVTETAGYSVLYKTALRDGAQQDAPKNGSPGQDPSVLRYVHMGLYEIGLCHYEHKEHFKSTEVAADNLADAMKKGRKVLAPSTVQHICHVGTRPNPEHEKEQARWSAQREKSVQSRSHRP